MTSFAQPTGGDGFPIGEHLDHLVIYTPKEYQKDVPTTFGDKDAVLADVACVDCEEEWNDALAFQGRIISVTKNRIGELVLGRIGQVATRPGQNPAWVLSPFSDEDAERAIDFVNSRGADPEPEPEPEPVRRSVVRKSGDTSTGGTRGSALRQAAASTFS